MGDEEGLVCALLGRISSCGLIDRIRQGLGSDEQPGCLGAEVGVVAAVEADGGDPLCPSVRDLLIDGHVECPSARTLTSVWVLRSA